MPQNQAMLVYKDPYFNYGHVLNRNYSDKFGENGNFETDDNTKNYTYVDLNVKFDNRITIPEKLYIEFEGYSWRPLYVFGKDEEGNNR